MRIWKKSEFSRCFFILCAFLIVNADFDRDWNTETRKAGVKSMAINERNNPIKRVYYKDGKPKNGKPVRIVVGIDAMITQTRANNRINFGTAVMNNYKANYDRLPNDEAGHLVAAVLYGPPKWYNLVPQNKVVNRNAGGKFIVTDWFKTEKEIREFVDKNKKNQGKVQWRVLCFYSNTNRPTKFRFQSKFLLGNKKASKLPIEGTLDNTPPAKGIPGIGG